MHKDPARGYVVLLQLAKRRRALGWQAQFDEKQEVQERETLRDRNAPWG